MSTLMKLKYVCHSKFHYLGIHIMNATRIFSKKRQPEILLTNFHLSFRNIFRLPQRYGELYWNEDGATCKNNFNFWNLHLILFPYFFFNPGNVSNIVCTTLYHPFLPLSSPSVTWPYVPVFQIFTTYQWLDIHLSWFLNCTSSSWLRNSFQVSEAPCSVFTISCALLHYHFWWWCYYLY
jgi:hypothetical protein